MLKNISQLKMPILKLAAKQLCIASDGNALFCANYLLDEVSCGEKTGMLHILQLRARYAPLSIMM